MLPIYSYVNDQLGPLSGFVSFQPLMSIPGQHGIISSPRTVQSRKFQRGVSVITGQTLQAEKKEAGSGDCSGHYHRVQPDKSSFEEACQTHPVPSVIVSISDDESREHEEKINRKIAVVDDLICGAA